MGRVIPVHRFLPGHVNTLAHLTHLTNRTRQPQGRASCSRVFLPAGPILSGPPTAPVVAGLSVRRGGRDDEAGRCRDPGRCRPDGGNVRVVPTLG